MTNDIETDELQTLLGDGGATILDVRLAEDFDAAHLPGAVNIPVLEVTFPSRFADLGLDPAAPVCVYGHGRGSMEARVAAEKLERAGHREVLIYDDGLAAWREAGLELEKGDPLPPSPVWPTGRRDLDLAECRVEWLGRNLLNSHWGTVDLKSGHVVCSPGGLEGGELVLDMTTLACTDLAGDRLHDVLIAHLENDDFFDTGRFPEARYSITTGTFTRGANDGKVNLEVDGVLSMKDVTARQGVRLSAGVGPDGRVGAQGTMALDRTRWNVLYGSGRYFDRLGGHLVNDEIELRLRLVLAGS